MISPKVCVVIPTRERADTLFFTLQTCLQQRYANLEILVCDNFSQDNTSDVVASFSDNRIRYINSGQRLSMAENWEYAFTHVNADYVTVLGDDDALLPNAIQNLINLIEKFNYPIITWLKVEYCWPNYIDPELRDFIRIPLRNQLISISSTTSLRQLYKFQLGYSSGPCIYNSLVSMDCVKQIVKRDGRLFPATSPDIYSSLALASVTEHYLFSSFPFSINGASAQSNGTSYARPDLNSDAFKVFQKESNLGEDSFSLIRGSGTAAVVDALTQFSDCAKTPKPKINYKKAFKRIMTDLQGVSGALTSNARILERLTDKYGAKSFVKRNLLAKNSQPAGSQSKSLVDTTKVLNADSVIMWGDRFGIQNVADASDFVGKVLGEYVLPAEPSQYTLSSRIYTRVVRRMSALKYYLGI